MESPDNLTFSQSFSQSQNQRKNLTFEDMQKLDLKIFKHPYL